MKTRFLDPAISKHPGIYKIIQKDTERIYVGSTFNIYKRCENHLSCLRNQKHSNTKLQADADKFGLASFEFEILEITPKDSEILNDREQYWQKQLGSTEYYNDPRVKRKGSNNRKCQMCDGPHYALDLCCRHYHYVRFKSKQTGATVADFLEEAVLKAHKELT